MRKNKLVQILESVSKKVETKTVSIEKPKFFVKYPNRLVDQSENSGRWQEIEKEDWMLSLPCAICGEVLLLRKDNPVCTRCRRS